MRRLTLALFGLLLLSPAVASPAVAAEPFRVRVLSYNIHHAEGTDGKLDLERIANIIKSTRSDLVALQEIDYENDRTGRVNQATALAKLTGLKAVAGDNIDYRGGRYGNAALVRWPIASSRNHLLPLLGSEQRGALVVDVEPGEGRPPLRFLATHLDNRSDAERLASAKAINELVARFDGPAILAGDLNATPDSDVLDRFGKAWENPTAAKPLPTIPSAEPQRQIDFVLVRPAESWRMVEAQVLDEPVASDHRPLLVVLEWRE